LLKNNAANSSESECYHLAWYLHNIYVMVKKQSLRNKKPKY